MHLNVNEASRRYSPAAVVAVSREVESGVPTQISTSIGVVQAMIVSSQQTIMDGNPLFTYVMLTKFTLALCWPARKPKIAWH